MTSFPNKKSYSDNKTDRQVYNKKNIYDFMYLEWHSTRIYAVKEVFKIFISLLN